MRLAFVIVGVSVVFAPAVWCLDARQGEARRDQDVIRAILRDSVVRIASSIDGGKKALSDLPPTVLSAETLVICDAKPIGPCISSDVTKIARSCAAAGRVPQPLVPLLERNIVARSLTAVEFSDLSMVERLSDLKGQASFPIAVSAPVYYRDRSLVYVQFGHPWNNRTWLTLLSYSREKGWAVVSEFPVSIGDAP